MAHITSLFNRIEKILLATSAFTLLVMMLWIFTDVILRFFLNRPIPGTIELTGEYLMVLLVYLSLSYTYKVDGHVKVTMFEEKFSINIKKITTFITNLLAAFFFIYISILNFLNGLEHFQMGIKSSGVLNYPLAPAFMIISLGLLTISLRLLIECIAILIQQNTKKPSIADSNKGLKSTI
ncbi:TRAP transporter small permease [Pueribacillus theae]|nr:TRAP transporter small permease [Pueribacillus theae]